MDEARKLDDSQVAEDGSEHFDDYSERRRLESESRDRRVIKRMEDPQIKLFAVHISRLANAWIGLSALYVAGLAYAQLSEGFAKASRAFFYGVVVAALASFVYRLGSSARSYVENESQARLTKLIENCFFMIFAMVVVSFIFGLAHLLSIY